jgi:hypothetical protein
MNRAKLRRLQERNDREDSRTIDKIGSSILSRHTAKQGKHTRRYEHNQQYHGSIVMLHSVNHGGKHGTITSRVAMPCWLKKDVPKFRKITVNSRNEIAGGIRYLQNTTHYKTGEFLA